MSNSLKRLFPLCLVFTLALAACGHSYDAKSLEGTWELQSAEGGVSVPKLHFEGGKLQVPNLLGDLAFATPYTVDGNKLKTQPNASEKKGQVQLEAEIDSLTSDTLVLKKGSAKFTYKKSAR